MSFDWNYATSSVTAFLSSGYFVVLICGLAACGLFKRLLKFVFMILTIYLLFRLVQSGVFADAWLWVVTTVKSWNIPGVIENAGKALKDVFS